MIFGPTHRYGTSANGLPAALEAFTVADLQSFYRAHYRPDNATILVVGDVTPATLVPMLEKQFGSWKADGMAALAPTDAGPDAGAGFETAATPRDAGAPARQGTQRSGNSASTRAANSTNAVAQNTGLRNRLNSPGSRRVEPSR